MAQIHEVEESPDEPAQDHVPELDPVTDEIVGIMEQSVNQPASWTKNAVLLLVSLGMFMAVSRGQQDWTWTLLLIPVLLIHELGHFFAMRICGYHNTRIFFIPFFGAAASGTNVSAAGWKRVFVALAGPVVGLLAGCLAGGAGLLIQQPLLVRFGVISCIINVFNLIPIMPLDGGWVMHQILFSRHPLTDAAFRVCGALALCLIAYALGEIPLGLLGGWVLLGAFGAFKIGNIACTLRRQGMEPASEEQPGLDRALAVQAAEETRKAYRKTPNFSNKDLATLSLQVYSLIHARPPGALASLCWGGVHALTFIVGVAGLIGLMVGEFALFPHNVPVPPGAMGDGFVPPLPIDPS